MAISPLILILTHSILQVSPSLLVLKAQLLLGLVESPGVLLLVSLFPTFGTMSVMEEDLEEAFRSEI